MNFKTHSFEDEIFATGVWNNIPVNLAMLDDIAANFNKLSAVLKVPLKLGHNEEQSVTDGQPALGWIDSVIVKGNKLFAKYIDVPEIVHHAITKKLYRTRSIELDFGVKHKGETFDHVLTAVALLGADLPAVNTLSDLNKYLMSKDNENNLDFSKYETASRRDTSITAGKQMKFSINLEKESTMDAKEIAQLQADLAAAKLNAAKLEADKVALTSANAQFSTDKKAREDADKKAAIKVSRDNVTALFEKAVKSNVITPAARETFSKLLGVDDDEKVVGISTDDIKSLLGDKGVAMFSKKGTAGEGEGESELSADEQLRDMTFAQMEKTGSEDFSKAMFSVMRANPKLANEYKTSNGIKGV